MWLALKDSLNMSEDLKQLKLILEGAILAAGEPLNLKRLGTLFEEGQAPEKDVLLSALQEIQQDCEDRGFALVEVASGWRFIVRENLSQWVNKLWDEKPQKYSRALLETLALIAYRQPITRGDIEEVRGVAVSSHIIKTLSERDWIKVVGHRDVPGRPSLYATSKQFLDYFNLKNLEDLPTLSELKDIETLNKNLDFEGATDISNIQAEIAAERVDEESELQDHDTTTISEVADDVAAGEETSQDPSVAVSEKENDAANNEVSSGEVEESINSSEDDVTSIIEEQNENNHTEQNSVDMAVDELDEAEQAEPSTEPVKIDDEITNDR